MAPLSEFRDNLVDLLWSQWHELGVAATVPRRHADDCIDPEALIAFTATRSRLDARLRDEAIDWVLQYAPYVSRVRLKNILRDWGELDEPQFQEFAATVNAHGHAGWPAGRAEALSFRPRSRSVLQDLSAPALLSLRIRAIFGVGARAELIRAFFARPQPAMTATELATETSYGKRNVLNEVEALRFASVVASFRAVNADRYSLTRTAELGALLGPLPRRYTGWARTFAALGLLLDLLEGGVKRSDLLNAAEAARVLEERRDVFVNAGMYPPPLPKGATAWAHASAWAVDYARVLAGK